MFVKRSHSSVTLQVLLSHSVRSLKKTNTNVCWDKGKDHPGITGEKTKAGMSLMGAL